MAVKIQRYVYNLQAITMTYLPLFMMMNIDLNIYCVQDHRLPLLSYILKNIKKTSEHSREYVQIPLSSPFRFANNCSQGASGKCEQTGEHNNYMAVRSTLQRRFPVVNLHMNHLLNQLRHI